MRTLREVLHMVEPSGALTSARGFVHLLALQPPIALRYLVERYSQQGDVLQPSAVLIPDQAVNSANGRYALVYQGDGNLVLYKNYPDRDRRALWASDTAGRPAGVCRMQGDGNLVISGPDGQYMWDSSTHGHPGSHLVVQDDGNVVIYRPDNTPIWATDTWIQPIWIIAHRCNNENDIPEALAAGANAIEFDVMSDATRFIVKHPGAIDFHVPSIETYLRAVLREQDQLTLLYVDYKGPDFSPEACARLVERMRAAQIPAAGLKVIFSTASLDHQRWFGGVPKEAWIAPQVDEANAPEAAEAFFRTSGFAHAWYGDGIAPIVPEPSRVETHIRRAIQLRDQGTVIRGVVIWTINTMASMRAYLELGVNAILTDDPDDAAEVLAEPAFRTHYASADKYDAPW